MEAAITGSFRGHGREHDVLTFAIVVGDGDGRLEDVDAFLAVADPAIASARRMGLRARLDVTVEARDAAGEMPLVFDNRLFTALARHYVGLTVACRERMRPMRDSP